MDFINTATLSLKPTTHSNVQSTIHTQTPVIHNASAINEALTRTGDKSTILADGEKVTFTQAIKELMSIFQNDEAEITKSICEFVTTGNITDADSKLYAWSAKYHNTKLQTALGEQFSVSVIRNGLLDAMRDFDKKGLLKSETEVVLLGYFEAHNARVISERIGKGSIPDWSFVNTNLALRCLQALKNNQYSLSTQAQAFLGVKDLSLGLQLECTALQQEIQYTALHNHIAYQAQELAKQKLSVDHVENGETGADKLVSNENQIKETVSAFKENNVSVTPMKNTIEELTDALSKFDTEFSSLNNEFGDKGQFLLIKWDASEYLGNIQVAIDIALKTIEQLDQREYEAVSKTFNDRLKDMPHVQDILERNQTGNYPGKERNELLAQVPELDRLFRQSAFKTS